MTLKIVSDLSQCRGFGDRLCLLLATGGGLGYARKAPGTWGSLPGLALGASLYAVTSKLPNPWSQALLLLSLGLLIFGAYYAIGRTERLLSVHDDPKIVADEVVGQGIACCLFAPSLLNLLVAFILFRILDILKPGPIGYLDREVSGAWGTLLDDVAAGGVVAVVMFWLAPLAFG